MPESELRNLPINLVTARENTADRICEKLHEILKLAEKRNFTAMAVVIASTDGTTFVSTESNKNRTLLLGAVADLQYTLAKDGDC